jgi:hypothetical protein
MIHITKFGFKCFEWDSDQRCNVEVEFDSICCLREVVTQIDEDVTLGDIVTLTHNDEFLRGFIGAYSSCNVDLYYNELQEGVNAPSKKIQYATMCVNIEITKHKTGDHLKVLEVDTDLYGKGEGKERWALDLSTMREIGALPFRLEANSTVQTISNDNYKVEDEFFYSPSLLELLDTIFLDISFFGDPKEKIKQKKEIQKQYDEIKSGKAKIVPFDSFGKSVKK